MKAGPSSWSLITAQGATTTPDSQGVCLFLTYTTTSMLGQYAKQLAIATGLSTSGASDSNTFYGLLEGGNVITFNNVPIIENNALRLGYALSLNQAASLNNNVILPAPSTFTSGTQYCTAWSTLPASAFLYLQSIALTYSPWQTAGEAWELPGATYQIRLS